MGLGEDEFLVPRRAEFGHGGTTSDRHSQQRPGARKLLQPLALAVGIFGVSAGAAHYLFPRKKLQPQQQVLAAAGPPLDSADAPTTAVCAAADGTVMDGADVVSYFSLEPGSGAVFGVAEHESVYNGYTFWFASEENKALFEENPLAYIPAWGGFCGWGIAREDWWDKDTLGPDADPNLWLISDEGKLHFFRSPTPMFKFTLDIPANIRAGDEVWSSWWGGVDPGAPEVMQGSPLDTNCFCSAETCVDG